MTRPKSLTVNRRKRVMARSTAAQWLWGMFGRRSRGGQRRGPARCRRTVGLQVECLEVRTVPTVLSTQLLFENFDGSDTNGYSANWSVVRGATHDAFLRMNPPSSPYAIRLAVDANGGNLLTSRPVDLSAETNVTLSYFYERTGGGAATAAGDDLVVEARDASGNWVEVERGIGRGATSL